MRFAVIKTEQRTVHFEHVHVVHKLTVWSWPVTCRDEYQPMHHSWFSVCADDDQPASVRYWQTRRSPRVQWPEVTAPPWLHRRCSLYLSRETRQRWCSCTQLQSSLSERTNRVECEQPRGTATDWWGGRERRQRRERINNIGAGGGALGGRGRTARPGRGSETTTTTTTQTTTNRRTDRQTDGQAALNAQQLSLILTECSEHPPSAPVCRPTLSCYHKQRDRQTSSSVKCLSPTVRI